MTPSQKLKREILMQYDAAIGLGAMTSNIDEIYQDLHDSGELNHIEAEFQQSTPNCIAPIAGEWLGWTSGNNWIESAFELQYHETSPTINYFTSK